MNRFAKIIDFHRRKRTIAKLYKKAVGCKPNLVTPYCSSEKIQYRKLYGNHTFYALLADKYKVREYVTERAGKKYLVPLLSVCEELTPEILTALPTPFIIKCNHGCKWHRIVKDIKLINIAETVHYFNETLKLKYSAASGERHYDFIEPKIIVEKLLDDNSEPPWDYAIYSYNGQNGFNFAIAVSAPDMSSLAHFDRDWNLWEGNLTDEQMKKYVKPKNFHEMVEVARLLSAGIDFVRVDLYNINGKIYFGELTFTPHSGLGKIKNEFRKKMRAEMWELAADNRQLYQKRGWFAD